MRNNKLFGFLIVIAVLFAIALNPVNADDYTINGENTGNFKGVANGGGSPQMSIYQADDTPVTSGTWNAENSDSVTMTGGSLSISGYDGSTLKNGIINATGGNISVTDGVLNIGAGSSITNAVITTIGSGSTLSLTGGTLYISDNLTIAGTLAEATSGNIIFSKDANISAFPISGSTNVSVEASKTLTIDAVTSTTGSLTNAGTVDGDANLTIGDGSNATTGTITGNGSLTINGDFTNSGLLERTTIIGNTGSLSTAGVDDPDSVTSGLNAAVTNNGALTLTGGTVVGNVTGSGTTTIDGAVTSNASIGSSGGITINSGSGKSLTISATNIGANVENRGTLEVTGTGTIGYDISDTQGTKTGITNISGTNITLDSAKSIAQKALNILSGKLTAIADAITTVDGVTNAGSYVLTGGTSESYKANANVISGSGTTYIGDSENDAYVSNDKTISQAVTVQNNGNFKNVTGGSVTGLTTVNSGSTATNTAGSLNTVENAGTLNVSGGSVTSITNTATGTQGVNQSGGTVTTVANTGKYNLTGGTVTNYGQTDGELNISNGASLTLTGNNTITDGTVNLGKASPASVGTLIINNGKTTNAAKVTTTGASVLNIQNGTLTTSAETNIGSDAVVTIGTADDTTGALTLTAGEATLGANDNWNAKGTVTVNGGTLNLGGTTQNGTFSQTSGTTNITAAQTIGKAGVSTSITGGTLNVNNNLTIAGSSTGATQTTITSGDGTAKVVIASGKTLDIQGGTVTLDGGSTSFYGDTSKTITDSQVQWVGDVTLNGGSLILENIIDKTRVAGTTTASHYNKEGRLIANTGNLTINTSNVLLGNSDTIADAVNLATYADITVATGATLYITSDSEWKNGHITLAGGTLNLNGIATGVKTEAPAHDKALIANTGNLTFTGSASTLGHASDLIDKAVITAVNSDLTINNGTASVTLNDIGVTSPQDSWTKAITLTNGNLTLDNVTLTTDNSSGKNYNQSNGTLTLNNNTSLTLNEDSAITNDSKVVLGEGTGNTKGTLIINNGITTNQAKVTTAGTGNSAFTVKGANTSFTTLTGTDFEVGSVTVGGGTDASVLNVDNNAIIARAVNLTINNGTTGTNKNTLNLKGTANVTINTGDVWNGVLNQTAGSLTVLNDDYTKETGYLTASGGKIYIGNNTTTAGTLKIDNANDSIAQAVAVTIYDDENAGAISKLQQSAGTVILDGTNDDWRGAIELSGTGTLTLLGTNDTTTAKKTYNQTAGTLKITDGGSLTLNTNASSITGTSNVVLGEGTNNTKGTLVLNNQSDNVAQVTMAGTNNNVLTVGNGTNATSLKLINNSEIAKKEVVTIAANSTLEVNGTTANGVSLNGGTGATSDTWNGTVSQTGGKLHVEGYNNSTNRNGKITVTGGELDIDGGVLTVATGSSITADKTHAKVVIGSSSTMDITGGSVILNGLDSADGLTNVDWAGTVKLQDGSLTLSNIVDQSRNTTYNKTGLLNATGGTLTIDNTTVLLGNNDVIADTVNLVLTGNIYVGKDNGGGSYDTATVYIGRDDTGWTAGSVNLVNNGILTLNGITTNNTTKYVNAESGTLTLLDNKAGSGSGNTFNNASDLITYAVNTTVNSPININAGKVQLDNADTLTSGIITLNGGELDLAGVSTTNNQLVATTGTLKIESNTTTGKTTTLNNATGDSIAENVAMTIASGSTLKVNGSNANVKVNANDTWSGNLELNNGNIEIKGSRTDSTTDEQTYVQDGGTLTIDDGASLTLNTDTGVSSKITNGNVVLGEGTGNTKGTLIINNGITTNQAKVTTAGTGNSVFTVKGANTSFTTLTGTDFEVGSVTVGDGTDASVLNVDNNAIIARAVNLTINNGTTGTNKNTLNLKGTANVTINTGDVWNGVLNQTAGSLTVLNDDYTKTTGYLTSTGGSILIGDIVTPVAGTLILNNINDSIAAATAVTINTNGLLNQSAGTVVLDNATDTWNGAIALSGTGDLTLDGFTKVTNGTIKYEQSGGKAKLSSTSLSLAEATSKITDGFVELADTSTLNIKNGLTTNKAAVKMAAPTETLTVTDNTTMTVDNYTYDPLGVNQFKETSITAGTVTVGKSTDSSDASKLNVASGTIAKAVAFNVHNSAALNITGAGAVDETTPGAGDEIVAAVTLDSADIWNGAVNLSNDSGGAADHKNVRLTLDGITKTIGAGTATYTQTGGTLELINNTQFTIKDLNVSTVTDGDFHIDDTSSLIIKKGAYTTRHHQTSGLIDTMNNEIATNTLTGDMIIANDGIIGDGKANFKLDFNARSTKQSDKYAITGNMTSTDNTQKATVYVENWSIQNNESPIEERIVYKVFDASGYDNNISYKATQKEVLTPIGYYKLRGLNSGRYELYLSRFNPKVFRGAVATSAMYANQLSVNNMLFDHINFIAQGIDDKFINRTAATDPIFAPYQYSKKDGAIWFKPYGNFETLSLTQGLNVHNNTYGALIGVDLPYRELHKGWGMITTPYIGYNGGHQTYDGLSMWQNGGQLGVVNSFFKDNFMSSLSIYGGLYGNSMSVMNADEDTFNAFAGVASKTAYNVNLPANFVLQPTFLFSYNWFSKQNWSTDYGAMSMKTGMLNGINIAPGANLIWKKDTFSLYLTLQYMFNINDKIDGKAGNVTLPSLRMRHNGYIEYGFGGTKTFKDRLTTYVQMTFRNIGRTGIGVQGGMNWRL